MTTLIPASTTNTLPTLAKVSATAAAVLMGGVSAFELALLAGVPWGNAAFGGAEAVLSPPLRIAAAVSVLVWAGAALVVLRRAGHRVWAPLPTKALPIAVWVLAGYTAIGILVNAISPSPIERMIWVPLTAVISALLFTVAISSRRIARQAATR